MKVLIVSHNPVSTYNGMGKTISTFFAGFEKSEVCQFYIFPSYPDVDICSSYYRVTDKEILKSFFNFKAPGSKVDSVHIGKGATCYENANDEKIYANKKNKRPFRVLLRDVMWQLSKWYNHRFQQWLNEEKPDCIFLAPGGAKFIYNVALKISRKMNIPIVTYIADEYYFIEPERGILGKIQQILLKRKIREILAVSKSVVTISEEFEKVYSDKFGCNATTIMTGSNFSVDHIIPTNDYVDGISYFGNIAYGRYKSLATIGSVLDEINADRGTNYRLDIYSAQKDDAATKVFENVRSIHWHGFVSGKEFEDKFFAAGLLLHTEDFEDRNVDLVKHSVSTKIADTLSAGIPLVAYGPENISSMKHLIRNNCAFIATSKETLKSTLEIALTDKVARQQVSQHAMQTASEYHNKERNSAKLKSIFADIRKI